MQPFEPIRILEFAQSIAGPYAAMILADMAADVIKVEPPTWRPPEICYYGSIL